MTGKLMQAGLALAVLAGAADAMPPHYDTWQAFGKKDGLPSDKALCVAATGDSVWVGTDRGLARYANGKWRTYTPKDGLAHLAVMSIYEDHDTGDIWIGTLGGLSRYSAGRFDTFTQLNSGLANDVVYGLTVRNGEVWAATAAGASRYEIAEKRWTIYNETNTPMHEIWCYSATACKNMIYLAVWGGGLLEYTRASDRWRDYNDPDGEMEIDLFRNDGLVHDVVASVDCDASDRVWIGTYFGLSSYDGRKWHNFMDHDSPLVSNFINYVRTRGTECWIGTDTGLNATDRKDWWTYGRDEKTGRGFVIYTPEKGKPERVETATALPHNYVLGISFQGDDIWVATEAGVARGTLSGATAARTMPKSDRPASNGPGEATTP